ncbi:hypothetical protein B0H11DRAFT_2202559 [Mycena galericulata]|nr:hypothetical protein B0H11DRAFT_2202559 [Mycena galericulata]
MPHPFGYSHDPKDTNETDILSTPLSRYPRLTTPVDALLRFITTLPSAHPDLPAGTVAFYTALAALRTNAPPPWTLHSPPSPRTAECSVQHAWADLLGVWAVCAAYPHQTTPEHNILWSHPLVHGRAHASVMEAAEQGKGGESELIIDM